MINTILTLVFRSRYTNELHYINQLNKPTRTGQIKESLIETLCPVVDNFPAHDNNAKIA